MGAPDAILVLLDGVRHVDDSSHRAAPIRPVGDIFGAPISHNANHQPAVSCTGIAQLKQPRETLGQVMAAEQGLGPCGPVVPSRRGPSGTGGVARLLGVKQTAMANKGRLIMDTLRTGLLDPEHCRRDLLDHNPPVWLLEVDGLLVDARWLPEAVQVQAWQRGLIPYVPARAGRDDPAGSSASRS
jgi:hypothetical protein